MRPLAPDQSPEPTHGFASWRVSIQASAAQVAVTLAQERLDVIVELLATGSRELTPVQRATVAEEAETLANAASRAATQALHLWDAASRSGHRHEAVMVGACPVLERRGCGFAATNSLSRP